MKRIRLIPVFYVSLLLAILLEVVLTAVFVFPLFSKFVGRYRQWQEISAEAKELKGIIAGLSGLESTVLAEDLRKAVAALPDEKKTTGLVKGLSALAASRGMTVQKLEFAPGRISTAAAQLTPIKSELKDEAVAETVIGQGVKATPASLTVVGNLSSVADFLEALTTTSQVLGVTRVEYAPAVGGGSASVGLLIYFQPKKELSSLWKTIKPLSGQEEEILQSLPAEDIFTLPPEEH